MRGLIGVAWVLRMRDRDALRMNEGKGDLRGWCHQSRRFLDALSAICGDTGPAISGAKAVEEMLELVIATASGEYVPKAVAMGQDDFLPWKRGVSL